MVKIKKFIKFTFFCIILFQILLTSPLMANEPSVNSEKFAKPVPLPTKTHYVERESIIVDNDTHFASFSFPGTGAVDNPYIIENYLITAGAGRGINIQDTTVYFIIRDCHIENRGQGIRINNVTANTAIIDNNTCINNGNNGILVLYSEQVNITNNYCNGSSNGISLNAESSYIANNTCLNNQLYGISVGGSYSSIIYNNTCKGSYYGIKVSNSNLTVVSKNHCSLNDYYEIGIIESGSCLVVDNVCSDSTNPEGRIHKYGMYLSLSDGSTVENNTFDMSGLSLYHLTLEGFASYTIRFNEVNDKLLGYFKHEEDLVLSYPTYGQIILINCTNAHISNQYFHDLPFEAIFVYESPDTYITQNYFRRIGRYAVNIENSPYFGATYNNFEDNYYLGLYLNNADNATIGDNTFLRNVVSLSCYDSDAPIITSNIFEQTSDKDIFIAECNGSSILDNICDNSGIILLSELNYGLHLDRAYYALVQGNTFYRYEGYGMEIQRTFNSEIKFNLFQENTVYGIYLVNSADNTIHHNTFQDNNLGGDSQAYSDSYLGYNNWYDPLVNEGNWWSDWDGTGSYFVFQEEDPYPLSEPLVPPIVPELSTRFRFALLSLILPFVVGLYYYRKVRK
ncbi:MAG: right-handed parallel beta-helix repeat-containing protein [Candidatus Heimdallarchaeaceae archaeon]